MLTKAGMDERTWQLFTKAACSMEQRVRGQVVAQRDGFGTRSGPYERIELDDGHCSCHPPTATQDEQPNA
ncbi:MAG: hypothetical protein H0T65_22215 [Deltaproteobacteria bacterium]|nr:hypothetical protein [Deltaproteobacteria bacterium]